MGVSHQKTDFVVALSALNLPSEPALQPADEEGTATTLTTCVEGREGVAAACFDTGWTRTMACSDLRAAGWWIYRSREGCGYRVVTWEGEPQNTVANPTQHRVGSSWLKREDWGWEGSGLYQQVLHLTGLLRT
jgi:hypothetical protein